MQQNKKSSVLAACIKDADMKQGIVTGYFASFNTIDSDNDIIMPGAFDKTIMEMGPASSKPRIKHLLNHDTAQPIGKLNVLKPDVKGLYYESKIGSNSVAVDVMKMIDSGLITEHSIGYGIVKKNVNNPDEDYSKQVTNLLELKLWEGSCLTAWGANMDTPLTGVKMRKKAISHIPKLIAAIRNGTFTDETFILLEKELLFLQEAINSDYETTEPDNSKDYTTQPNDEEKLLNSLQLLNARLAFN